MYIHSEDVSDVTYVSGRARVKVKAIGALTKSDVQTLHKAEPMEIYHESDIASVPSLSEVKLMEMC